MIRIAAEVEERLRAVHKPVTVAVMGCVVNGPGEAKEADIGIAGGDGKAVLFKKGENRAHGRGIVRGRGTDEGSGNIMSNATFTQIFAPCRRRLFRRPPKRGRRSNRVSIAAAAGFHARLLLDHFVAFEEIEQAERAVAKGLALSSVEFRPLYPADAVRRVLSHHRVVPAPPLHSGQQHLSGRSLPHRW